MRITFLSRGGLSVYGGIYDPHKDAAALAIRQGETRTITLEYPGPPTGVEISASGFTVGAATVSGNKVSFNVSGISHGGILDVTAAVNGEVRDVRIIAEVRQGASSVATIAVTADDGSVDYGVLDFSIPGNPLIGVI
jgi:hypothetical protein